MYANIFYSCCKESSLSEFGNSCQRQLFHIGINITIQTRRINTREGFFCNIWYHTGWKPVVWIVTYLRRNVTIVRDASYHLLGSQISWDLKIRFWLQVKSYISDWGFSKSWHLASYVSCHNAMAYDSLGHFEFKTFPYWGVTTNTRTSFLESGQFYAHPWARSLPGTTKAKLAYSLHANHWWQEMTHKDPKVWLVVELALWCCRL